MKKKKSPRLSHLPKHIISWKVPERDSAMCSPPSTAFSRFQMQTGVSSKCTEPPFPGSASVVLGRRTPFSCITTCLFHTVHRCSLNPINNTKQTDLSPTKNPEKRLRILVVSVGVAAMLSCYWCREFLKIVFLKSSQEQKVSLSPAVSLKLVTQTASSHNSNSWGSLGNLIPMEVTRSGPGAPRRVKFSLLSPALRFLHLKNAVSWAHFPSSFMKQQMWFSQGMPMEATFISSQLFYISSSHWFRCWKLLDFKSHFSSM